MRTLFLSRKRMPYDGRVALVLPLGPQWRAGETYAARALGSVNRSAWVIRPEAASS